MGVNIKQLKKASVKDDKIPYTALRIIQICIGNLRVFTANDFRTIASKEELIQKEFQKLYSENGDDESKVIPIFNTELSSISKNDFAWMTEQQFESSFPVDGFKQFEAKALREFAVKR